MATNRIMAGPGTGKTYTLMRKIENYLVGGIEPERMLLVTFTRTSALDLKRSLAKEIPNHPVDRVRSGTLHSFCLQILHSSGFFSFSQRIPRIMTSFELAFMFEDLKNIGIGNKRELERRLQAFEAAWAREHNQEPGWPIEAPDKAFNFALHNWLRFHQSMLIAEIIPETLRYLRANPMDSALTQYGYVFVDEYQDLNRAEQSLIDLFRSLELTVVGDEDQSIYQHLRHAHPEGIAQFNTSHPGTNDTALNECFRCPKRVVNMANELIEKNQSRTPRSMFPNAMSPAGEIHVVQWEDMEAEARGLAEMINNKIRSGEFSPGQVLVLTPRRQFGYAIRDALKELGQEVHSLFSEQELEGNPREIDNCDAQQAYTLLRLLDNVEDRVSLRAWLGFGHSSLRATEYKRLWDYCHSNSISPIQCLEGLVQGTIKISGKISGLLDRYQILQNKLEELREKSVEEIISYIFPTSAAWAQPFVQMIENAEIAELKDVLERIQTEISQPEMPADVEYIRVMSLHKSKGLSADHVFVTGFIQGLVPQFPPESLEEIEKERFAEEQRRLFYVAVTRAKKTLILSSVRTLTRKDAYSMNAHALPIAFSPYVRTVTSMFLQELGSDCPIGVVGDAWLKTMIGEVSS